MGCQMLDAYIIERIRREREESEREGAFVPLRIDLPETWPARSEERPPPEPERGSVVIDFSI